jgi:N utilization substance protein B
MDITEAGRGGSAEPGIDLTVPDDDGGDEYCAEIVRGVIDKLKEIDGRIGECSEHWRIDRIAVVDRNVLRIAVYELLYRPQIPYRVVIDEAIEVAKTFGTVDSGAFVNGLLDELHKKIR